MLYNSNEGFRAPKGLEYIINSGQGMRPVLSYLGSGPIIKYFAIMYFSMIVLILDDYVLETVPM